ncbi:hypothetical protein ACWGLF_22740 [Streptomyces puniciscabiei]
MEFSGDHAPTQTDTTYDEAARPTQAVTKAHGVTRCPPRALLDPAPPAPPDPG